MAGSKDKHINFQDYKDTDITRLEESAVHKTPSRIKWWKNGKVSGSYGDMCAIDYVLDVIKHDENLKSR